MKPQKHIKLLFVSSNKFEKIDRLQRPHPYGIFIGKVLVISTQVLGLKSV
jgi:hypothetical protein